MDASDPDTLDLAEVRAVSILGRGAKGIVLHALHGDQSLALKVISRSTLGSGYRRVQFEREVLASLHHPLLPSLRGFASTDDLVAFALDRCTGGDLNSLRRRQTEKMFSEDVIRFYAAEIVLALEHLHGKGIVYRDLKPENILIQSDGHVMLVDFDLSTRLPPASPPRSQELKQSPRVDKPVRRVRSLSCFTRAQVVEEESSSSPSSLSSSSHSGKTNSFVGTEEYVAPEVIEGKGHDYAVDWWGLGVVMYEMLYGNTPFRGANRKETFYRILSMAPDMVGEKTELRDLIGRLLEKDPERRIGCEEVKAHSFFRGVNWGEVVRVARPPFIPFDGAQEVGVGEGVEVAVLVKEVLEGIAKKKEVVEEEKGAKWEGGVNNNNASNKSTDFGVF